MHNIHEIQSFQKTCNQQADSLNSNKNKRSSILYGFDTQKSFEAQIMKQVKSLLAKRERAFGSREQTV